MNVDEAMDVIARSAGDELAGFLGDARVPTSEEALLTAGRVILEAAGQELEPLPPELKNLDKATSTRMVIREIQAQALEDWWRVQAAPILDKPEKRAALVGFIEARTGRPLPLEDDV